MHIQFHGDAGEVTSSCQLIAVGDHRILLDCGLVHSETDSMQVLAERIQTELNAPVHEAQLCEQIDLLQSGKFTA